MDNAINLDMLTEAFEIYEQNLAAEIPKADFEPSKDFERKMDKLIKSERSVYHRLTLTKARRAIAIATVIAVLLASAMSVSAIREKIFSFFVSRGNQIDVTEYDTEQASYPTELERQLKPDYLPEGYSLEDSSFEDNSAYLLYTKGDDYLTIEQFVKSEYKSATDGEYKTEKKLTEDGTEFIVRTSDDGSVMLVFDKDGYVFELVGFESEDELVKTASSLM